MLGINVTDATCASSGLKIYWGMSVGDLVVVGEYVADRMEGLRSSL